MSWWRKTGAFEAWVEKWQIGPGMNDSNPGVQEFVKDMPEITGPMAKRLYSGFDGTVGEGWVPVLDRLAADLVALGWDRDLHQIKEKFGGLRFYTGQTTPEMDRRIDQAEAECWQTCENCGAPGEAKGPGWLLTLCETCRAAFNASRRDPAKP